MRRKFLVIGLGRFGMQVAKALNEMNSDILAIDIESNRVEKASEFLSYCEICDASKMEVLKELNAQSFDTAIISIGSLEATFLTIANLNELGVERIIVRLETDEYANICKKLGASEIIIPEEAAASSLAHGVMSDNILDYYEINDNYGVVQVRINESFTPKNLIDLDIRNRFDVNIVGIIRGKDFFIPKGVDTINPLDIVLVVGKQNKISKFEREMNL